MAQQNDRYNWARKLFGLLFILSTCLLIALVLNYRISGLQSEGPHTPSILDRITGNLVAVLSLLSSIGSLVGLAATTYLQWRADRREEKTALLDRQRQELEIEKLKRQLRKQETKDRDHDH